MDEEQRIILMHGSAQACWEQLQRKLPDVYGIPFLLHWDGKATRPGNVLPDKENNPQRCLILEDANVGWFLIEHPSAIELFDQFANGSHRLALAKPSLFARLWRESERPARTSAYIAEAALPNTDSDRQALQRTLNRLCEKGPFSDWHLEPWSGGFRSRLRVHGKLVAGETLTRDRGRWLQNSLRAQAGIKEGECRTACEGRLTIEQDDGSFTLRLSFIPSLYGQAMVARFLFPGCPSLDGQEALGLETCFWKGVLARYSDREGLWLVVGPTGSGKSTTCHALLRESARNNEKILTAEDPVEQVVAGVQQVSLDPARGLTYARVMRAFLRQAPDTILIGEIRDAETASIAVQASRTGHRILSTLHARDDPGVLRRLQDLGQDPDSIKPMLKLVLHQRLMPRLCSHCRKERPVSASWKACILASRLEPLQTSAHPTGCPSCQSGYNGRIALFSSGNFLEEPTVSGQLLKSAWPHVCGGELCLNDCRGLFPSATSSPFQLCQP